MTNDPEAQGLQTAITCYGVQVYRSVGQFLWSRLGCLTHLGPAVVGWVALLTLLGSHLFRGWLAVS